MAEKYEIDFHRFEYDALAALYTEAQAVKLGEDALAAKTLNVSGTNAVTDILSQYKRKVQKAYAEPLTVSQREYLVRLCYRLSPEYAKHDADFWAWYNGRPDMHEVYQYGMQNANYAMNPANGEWVYKDGKDWDKSWETTPANSEMFFRVTGDYNVRRFREVNRDPVFSEGDLVHLRAAFIGRRDYDPLYGTIDRYGTPDASVMRLGTVMQLTTEINRYSRGGKGSRNVNVLWFGTTEPMMVPERIIKHHERKRRAKKA